MTERRYATDSPPPRPSLSRATFAHYADPAYYDRAYRRHRIDVSFYVRAALELGGPVLELGCGTGRISLPLARAGIEVVGVDLSAEMIAAARDKLSAQSEAVQRCVEFRRGDLRSLALDRTFPLIISPFNVLQHLYTRLDVERCLDVVARHLEPHSGRFVFDVLMPDVRSLSRNPGRRYKLGKLYHPAGDKRYDYRESFDYDPITQIQYITMHFDDPDDPEASFSVPLSHRQFFPRELEALLHYNGFLVEALYGSFDFEPLEEESETQVYRCRPT